MSPIVEDTAIVINVLGNYFKPLFSRRVSVCEGIALLIGSAEDLEFGKVKIYWEITVPAQASPQYGSLNVIAEPKGNRHQRKS